MKQQCESLNWDYFHSQGPAPLCLRHRASMYALLSAREHLINYRSSSSAEDQALQLTGHAPITVKAQCRDVIENDGRLTTDIARHLFGSISVYVNCEPAIYRA
jgi:hypothetical protein